MQHYSLFDEVCSLFIVEVAFRLIWLMCLCMHDVEETGKQTTKGRPECVRVHVVVDPVGGAELKDGVRSDSNSDGRVKACTECVGSSDAAKQSRNDSDGSCDTLALACSVLSLDHEDDADEHERADYLIDAHLQVHVEVNLVFVLVWQACDRVLGGKHGHSAVGLVKRSEPADADGEEAAEDLRDDDLNHEEEVLAVVTQCGEDADCHSRVEVSACHVAKDDY